MLRGKPARITARLSSCQLRTASKTQIIPSRRICHDDDDDDDDEVMVMEEEEDEKNDEGVHEGMDRWMDGWTDGYTACCALPQDS